MATKDGIDETKERVSLSFMPLSYIRTDPEHYREVPSKIPALTSAFLQALTTLLYDGFSIDERARKTTSNPDQGAPRSNATARRRRFAPFLHTALPDFFPAIKATRP